MRSEHHNGSTILVRITNGHNKVYVVVRDFVGPVRVDANLLTAIDNRLKERYGDARWTSFDSVEILTTGGAL